MGAFRSLVRPFTLPPYPVNHLATWTELGCCDYTDTLTFPQLADIQCQRKRLSAVG